MGSLFGSSLLCADDLDGDWETRRLGDSAGLGVWASLFTRQVTWLS